VEGLGIRISSLGFEVPGFGLRVEGGGFTSLRRNVKRFRGGLVFKAHRLVYHLRVIKKKRRLTSREPERREAPIPSQPRL